MSIQPGGDDSTVDNEFLFNDLIPNTVYFISILPRGLKNNGDASETTTWLVQTLDEGQCLSVYKCTVCACVMCVLVWHRFSCSCIELYFSSLPGQANTICPCFT